MQQDGVRDKHTKKKKGRTWAEAAKIVLEMQPKTPLSLTEILRVIKQKSLKEISGSAPLACLNSMLHVHSHGPDPLFYKVTDRVGVYGLKSDIPEGAVLLEMEEEMNVDANSYEDNDALDITSHKSFKEKRKEKVLYVNLPPGYETSKASSSCHNGVSYSNEQAQSDLGGKIEISSSMVASIPRLTSNVARKNCNTSQLLSGNSSSTSPAKVSQTHSKRAIKHALKQQQKRRRKNTSIKAGASTVLYPRIITKPLPPRPASSCTSDSNSSSANSSGHIGIGDQEYPASSSPTPSRSLSLRSHSTANLVKSTHKVMSSCQARKRTRSKFDGDSEEETSKIRTIDMETPQSILVNTNLKTLLNKHAFTSLPPACQHRLLSLLPAVDCIGGTDGSLRLSSSALSNEFFARACQDWKDRLAEGEFIPENQVKQRAEEEKEQGKLDPWKVKHFEPVWGKKTLSEPISPAKSLANSLPIHSSKSPLSSSYASTSAMKSVLKAPRLIPVAVRLKSPTSFSNNTPSQVVDAQDFKDVKDFTPFTSNSLESPSSALEPNKDVSAIAPSYCSDLPVNEDSISDGDVTCEHLAEMADDITDDKLVSGCSVISPPLSPPSPYVSSPVKQASEEMVKSEENSKPTAVQPLLNIQTPVPTKPCAVTDARSSSSSSHTRRNADGVNLERSYQICQEVLRSSRNREALMHSNKFSLKTGNPMCSPMNASTPPASPIAQQALSLRPTNADVSCGHAQSIPVVLPALGRLGNSNAHVSSLIEGANPSSTGVGSLYLPAADAISQVTIPTGVILSATPRATMASVASNPSTLTYSNHLNTILPSLAYKNLNLNVVGCHLHNNLVVTTPSGPSKMLLPTRSIEPLVACTAATASPNFSMAPTMIALTQPNASLTPIMPTTTATAVTLSSVTMSAQHLCPNTLPLTNLLLQPLLFPATNSATTVVSPGFVSALSTAQVGCGGGSTLGTMANGGHCGSLTVVQTAGPPTGNVVIVGAPIGAAASLKNSRQPTSALLLQESISPIPPPSLLANNHDALGMLSGSVQAGTLGVNGQVVPKAGGTTGLVSRAGQDKVNGGFPSFNHLSENSSEPCTSLTTQESWNLIIGNGMTLLRRAGRLRPPAVVSHYLLSTKDKEGTVFHQHNTFGFRMRRKRPALKSFAREVQRPGRAASAPCGKSAALDSFGNLVRSSSLTGAFPSQKKSLQVKDLAGADSNLMPLPGGSGDSEGHFMQEADPETGMALLGQRSVSCSGVTGLSSHETAGLMFGGLTHCTAILMDNPSGMIVGSSSSRLSSRSLYTPTNSVCATNLSHADVDGVCILPEMESSLPLLSSNSSLRISLNQPPMSMLPQSVIVDSPLLPGLLTQAAAFPSTGCDEGATLERSSSNCACNLKALIMCKKCGAFCHDDCIGPLKLCVTCLLR